MSEIKNNLANKNKKKKKLISKERKIIILIIIIIILIVPISYWWIISNIHIIIFPTSGDLELTISTEKEIINKTQNESLLVYVELTNIADDDVFIQKDFSTLGIKLDFKITIPSNNTIFPFHPQVALYGIKCAFLSFSFIFSL